jgi:hypothetical protein
VLIEEDANGDSRRCIDATPSPVATYATPTDEERMTAAHTTTALAHSPGPSEQGRKPPI